MLIFLKVQDYAPKLVQFKVIIYSIWTIRKVLNLSIWTKLISFMSLFMVWYVVGALGIIPTQLYFSLLLLTPPLTIRKLRNAPTVDIYDILLFMICCYFFYCQNWFVATVLLQIVYFFHQDMNNI